MGTGGTGDTTKLDNWPLTPLQEHGTMFILGSLESQRRRQWGGAGPLNKIWPPARELARHNKRFTIEEIIKIVVTRCQILRLKCTKSFVGWGSAPDPAGGAYSAPPDPLAGF